MGESRGMLPTGTVTFLFSDIEGSTRLIQELGAAALELIERHHELLRAAFDGSGGAVVRTEGDSFFVAFRSAPDAVAAAAAAQRALDAERWPNGVAVRVRMGLHSGSGALAGDDYGGIDVHRAARIAAAAHGGQVVLSDATRGLAAHELPDGVTLRDLGPHRLKDLQTPERIFQLVIPGLRADFPPIRSLDARPNNLPTRLTSFVGRVKEMDDLRGLLAGNRLVSLTGPGGVGKTSLATELARQALDTFPDGCWYVGLEAINDPDLVASAIITALSIRDGGNRRPETLVRDYLRDRRLLLVLDNFERVLGAAELVGALLREAPDLMIVVTTRSPLHIVGEQEYQVSPLPLPRPGPGGEIDGALETLETVDAVRLFIDRARRAQPAFALTAENAPHVVEGCRRLDGLPLGIELAAASVALLAPATITERLARRLPLPGTVTRDLPDRQRTVDQTIAWSYELLEPGARRIFGRLSVFAGGWDLDAADSVCGPVAETGLTVLDGIVQLVDGSLVRALATGPTSRFAMLETIRDFAADRLEEAGDAPEFRRRHALHFLALAESAAPHLPGRNQLSWLARLTEERDNVRAAIQVVIDASDAEAGLRFAAALWRYWQFDGHIAEGRATIDAVFALPGAERPSPMRMRALEAAGGLLFWSAEPDGASAMYRAQLALARELEDRAGEADALFNLAHTIGAAADPAAGAEMFEAAGRLYRQLGDQRGEARVDATRGAILMLKGDALAARDILSMAADRLHELDDVFFEALAIANLGGIALSLGDLPESLLNWRRAMELSRELGDLASTTIGLKFMAIMAAEHGRPEAAVRINEAFEALCRTYAVRSPARLEVLLSRPNYAAQLFETLGRERFEMAVGQGRRMSLDEAVDDALAVSHEIETPSVLIVRSRTDLPNRERLRSCSATSRAQRDGAS
jgi:predicted ATPase/class 3 adenylate cyclase